MLFVEVAAASPALSSPLGGRVSWGRLCPRHPLLFRRSLVCMAPLGSSFDDLKFSSDDPAVFLESQCLSDDDCRFCLVRRLSSTVH